MGNEEVRWTSQTVIYEINISSVTISFWVFLKSACSVWLHHEMAGAVFFREYVKAYFDAKQVDPDWKCVLNTTQLCFEGILRCTLQKNWILMLLKLWLNMVQNGNEKLCAWLRTFLVIHECRTVNKQYAYSLQCSNNISSKIVLFIYVTNPIRILL